MTTTKMAIAAWVTAVVLATLCRSKNILVYLLSGPYYTFFHEANYGIYVAVVAALGFFLERLRVPASSIEAAVKFVIVLLLFAVVILRAFLNFIDFYEREVLQVKSSFPEEKIEYFDHEIEYFAAIAAIFFSFFSDVALGVNLLRLTYVPIRDIFFGLQGKYDQNMSNDPFDENNADILALTKVAAVVATLGFFFERLRSPAELIDAAVIIYGVIFLFVFFPSLAGPVVLVVIVPMTLVFFLVKRLLPTAAVTAKQQDLEDRRRALRCIAFILVYSPNRHFFGLLVFIFVKRLLPDAVTAEQQALEDRRWVLRTVGLALFLFPPLSFFHLDPGYDIAVSAVSVAAALVYFLVKRHRSPAEPTTQPLTFPEAGVKLSYILEEFIDDHCRDYDIQRMTTREVKEQIIETSTRHCQSSFCDMLKAEQHPAYGAKANVFISHAHQCRFWNTIQAVQRCVSKDTTQDYDDVVVWMDLFSINQHEPTDWTTDWLCDTFRSSIKQIGRAIMVMSPWDHPTPFTRTWCIFEAYSTLDTGGRFDIAMGEDDEKQFLNDILTAEDDDNSMSVMNRLLSTIKAENSQCTSPVDKKHIFEVIRATVGFEEIDRMVLKEYRNWAVVVLQTKAGQEGTEVEVKNRLLSVVRALQCGRWNGTKASFFEMEDREYLERFDALDVKVFQKRKQELGEDHPLTLESMHSLAISYYAKGEYNKALQLHTDCLNRRKSKMGEHHPDTLYSMQALAMVYRNNLSMDPHLDQAQTLYEDCLAKRRRVSGMRHPDTLSVMKGLASVHCKKRQYEKAQPFFEECLEKTRLVLGDDHPDTLTVTFDVALLYGYQGQYDQALPMHENCLEKRKLVLGGDHPETLDSMYELFYVYVRQGEYKKAITLSSDYIRAKVRVALFRAVHSILRITWVMVWVLLVLNLLFPLGIGFTSLASVGIVLLMTVWLNRVSLFRMFWGNRGFLFKTLMVVVTGLVFFFDVFIIIFGPCVSAVFDVNDGNFSMAHHKYDTCLPRFFKLQSMAILGNLHDLNTCFWNIESRDCVTNKALPIVEECPEQHKLVLGEIHPEMLRKMYILETFYWAIGDTNGAFEVAMLHGNQREFDWSTTSPHWPFWHRRDMPSDPWTVLFDLDSYQ